MSSWLCVNKGREFVVLSLSYTSQQRIRALGLAPSLPGWNLMVRLNYERNSDHLACQWDSALDSQK